MIPQYRISFCSTATARQCDARRAAAPLAAAAAAASTPHVAARRRPHVLLPPLRASSSDANSGTAAAAAAAHAASQTPAGGSSNGGGGGGDSADLERRLRAAYERGFEAGYLKGLDVRVDVGVALPDNSAGSSSKGRQQRPRQRAMVAGSGSANDLLPHGDAGSDSDGEGSSRAGGGGGRDSVARSVLKGLIWRLFSTCVTVGVAAAFLGDALSAQTALKFGGVEFAAKLTMYVLFERLWLLV